MKMMKVLRMITLATLIGIPAIGTSQLNEDEYAGEWITTSQNQGASNTWMQFYKEFNLEQLPSDEVIANIAVDSKYWLWVNGQMVVYEGGLKRGPLPEIPISTKWI